MHKSMNVTLCNVSEEAIQARNRPNGCRHLFIQAAVKCEVVERCIAGCDRFGGDDRPRTFNDAEAASPVRACSRRHRIHFIVYRPSRPLCAIDWNTAYHTSISFRILTVPSGDMLIESRSDLKSATIVVPSAPQPPGFPRPATSPYQHLSITDILIDGPCGSYYSASTASYASLRTPSWKVIRARSERTKVDHMVRRLHCSRTEIRYQF